MSDLFEKFLNSLTLEEETDYELAERMEQFKKETTERVSEDFEIQIKIAVYSTSGEFIKQHNGSSLSDETIRSIMDDIEKELKERG